MPLPVLARKMQKLASQQLHQLKQLLTGRGFIKFKRLYKIKGELGQGGFGIVYKGVRLSDMLPVAVKFIERRHVREWGRLGEQRVPMEICMLTRCNQLPGVITLLDWFSLPEGYLIVMERPSPCIDLFDFIQQQKYLDESLAKHLFSQIVKTIIDCSKLLVLHRDIKDENILLELNTGRIKLIDFGAATLLKKSRYQDFQSTRLYCPPEWFLHSLYLGQEATVWSLGVLLYNMLNGRLPFLNERDICTSHLLGPLPFYVPVSREARELLTQCLNFDPFLRPSLEQLLTHPWLTKTEIEWNKLNQHYKNGEEEYFEDEEKIKHSHESGLASEEYSNNSKEGEEDKAQKMFGGCYINAIPKIWAHNSSQANRRNAQTAHFGCQKHRDDENGEIPPYSILRPGLRQFELCPYNQEETEAGGSVDSGTSSALHSPRIMLNNPKF
uniref:non-specific serine/threonine protein kinase n=1 Tax=Meloidogyne hapla TaxID=6305 RepID=A0A1I8B102_MELHA